MPESNLNSIEQLRAMAASGKISAEEFELLRGAMEQQNAEQTRARAGAAQRLTKSRTQRQLGGVCAGLARRFQTEPWRARAVFVAAPALTSLCGLSAHNPFCVLPFFLFLFVTLFLLPLVYLLLFIFLPWDAPAVPAAAAAPVPRSGWLALQLILLWIVLNAILGFLMPHIEDSFRQRSAPPGFSGGFLFSASSLFLHYGFSFFFLCLALLCLHMTLADFPRPRAILGRVARGGCYGFLITLILLLGALFVAMRPLAH